MRVLTKGKFVLERINKMKKTTMKKVIIIGIMVIGMITLLALFNNVFATGVSTLDAGDKSKIYASSGTENIGGLVFGVVQTVCIAVALVLILWKGVQFMAAAPEGKAEIKKQLIAVAIGAGILFTIGAIIGIVQNVTSTALPI